MIPSGLNWVNFEPVDLRVHADWRNGSRPLGSLVRNVVLSIHFRGCAQFELPWSQGNSAFDCIPEGNSSCDHCLGRFLRPRYARRSPN
jgi:hypothetical protein